MIDPVTGMAIAQGAQALFTGLGGLFGGGAEKKANKLNQRQIELSEDELFLKLIQDRLDRERTNKLEQNLLQTTVPVGRHFAAQGLALSQGMSDAFSRSMSAPRTFATTDAQGNQAVSLQGAGGDVATPDQLSQLAAPPFEFFLEAAQKSLSEFTPENLSVERQSALDQPGVGRFKNDDPNKPNTELTRMIQEFQRRQRQNG